MLCYRDSEKNIERAIDTLLNLEALLPHNNSKPSNSSSSTSSNVSTTPQQPQTVDQGENPYVPLRQIVNATKPTSQPTSTTNSSSSSSGKDAKSEYTSIQAIRQEGNISDRKLFFG